jgi:hypothetical protein
MQNYANRGGDSNVQSFENGSDYITVEFGGNGRYTTYKYTYASAGQNMVEEMKSLALAGHGLNSYISSNKPQYAERW